MITLRRPVTRSAIIVASYSAVPPSYNDAFATGWAVTVDGRPAEILPANYSARGGR